MKIELLSADSMGTRSMATYVETEDMKLVIDPGVSLAPKRFGLPPHPLEVEKMERDWVEIKKRVDKSEYVVISHYHYDHHNPEEVEIFTDKIIYLKDPKNNINKSQRERAKYLLEKLNGICEVRVAEENSLVVGNTRVEFSGAVPHGPSTRLGYVIETRISEGDYKFVHTSDVEGPALEEQVKPIMENSPNIVYLDGPLSYIMYRYGRANLEKALENIKKIIDRGVEQIVYDHHFLRDPKYNEIIGPVEKYAREKGVKMMTAAEYMGEKPNPLEMIRKELYEKYPV